MIITIIIGSMFRLARGRTVLFIRGKIARLIRMGVFGLVGWAVVNLVSELLHSLVGQEAFEVLQVLLCRPFSVFGRGVLPVGRVAGRLGGRHGTGGVRVSPTPPGRQRRRVSGVAVQSARESGVAERARVPAPPSLRHAHSTLRTETCRL